MESQQIEAAQIFRESFTVILNTPVRRNAEGFAPKGIFGKAGWSRCDSPSARKARVKVLSLDFDIEYPTKDRLYCSFIAL
jgi:hypothetical protein